MGLKRLKLTYAWWICGLLIVAFSIPCALANTDYTYVFTANPGQVTWYNGTTIEISVAIGPPYPYPPYGEYCSLVSMHMVAEVDMAAWAGAYGYGPAPASLTPSSYSWSSGDGLTDMNIGSANRSGWGGGFDSGWGGAIPFDSPDLVFLIQSSSVGLYINSGGLDPDGFITTPASGTWTFVADAGSSFELLTTAMVALGAGRLVFRRRRN
jgi:hypothetical protein